MKYPVSGTATGTPDATSSINLLGQGIGSKRVFWLSRAWFYKNTKPADVVSLYDATGSTTGVPASTLLRYKILSDYGVSQKEVNFTEPGLKFETGCVISVDGTATGYSLCGALGHFEE